MKRVQFFVMLLIFTGSLLANPVPLPYARISEFMFDSNGNWVLEFSYPGPPIFLDSICLVCSNGSSRIRFQYVHDTTLQVITSDSLVSPLYINRTGDCIRLYTYHSYAGIDSLSFGNYPGSMCDSIPAGYSICRIGYYFNAENNGFLFCLSSRPTIGVPNDTTGCCATMTGKMFIYQEIE